MKHLNILLVAVLLLVGTGVSNAQDKNNPWAIELGVNAVDTYPVGVSDDGRLPKSSKGDLFHEYFNVNDHWNIIPSVSKVSVSRYMGDGFIFSATGTINSIEKVGDSKVDDLSYYAADGEIKYSFRDLLGGGWFDPTIGVGGGYTWVDDLGFGTANGLVGFRFWLTESLAVTAGSTYKHSFEDTYGITHFQHSMGVMFKFGGTDTDGDGIYDHEDECPEIPGLPEFNGCPDTDGDGIEDREDACPDAAGSAEMMGCPDTDGDGLADNKDNCPTEAGPAANDGCPWPDTDGDSVLDKDDACPDEAGSAANNGCADRDGDSVLDKDDECPDVPGTVARKGCPEPQITTEIMEQLNQYSRTILFDYNKTTVRQDSYSAIQSMIDIMNEYETTNFLIEGHSDSSGRDTYNLELSEKRASSVKLYLESKGVDSARLSSLGYGETRPKASNQTSAGRQENRRVEVSLVK